MGSLATRVAALVSTTATSKYVSRSLLTTPVALMSAAAGRSGGARANYALRLAMTPFRPRLLTEELLLAGARTAFDENGALTDEGAASRLSLLIERLAEEARR